MSLAVAPSPGSLVVRGGYPGPAGHQRMLPNLILVPEMMPPPFYFNTSKEHKHQEIHAHESSCVGNFAFLIEEEIENIPLFFFFTVKK